MAYCVFLKLVLGKERPNKGFNVTDEGFISTSDTQTHMQTHRQHHQQSDKQIYMYQMIENQREIIDHVQPFFCPAGESTQVCLCWLDIATGVHLVSPMTCIVF